MHIPKIELKGLVINEVISKGDYEMICLGRFEPINKDVIVEITDFDEHPEDHPKIGFKDKARSLEKLAHPNVIRLLAWGVQEHIGYLIYEAEDKDRLVDYFKEGIKFSPGEALTIVIDIAKALEHCHAQSLIHGELRPSNILFTSKDGKVKVRNFCIYEHEKKYVMEMVARRPQYVSPEQIRFSNIDHTTDIYSLGMILYELLMGHPAYDSQNVKDVWRMHLEAELPSLDSKFPSQPQITQLFHKCIAKDPKFRYQSISVLLHDLDFLKHLFPETDFKKYGRAAIKANVQSANLAKRKHHQRERKKKKQDNTPIILLVLVLIAGGIGAAIYLNQKPGKESNNSQQTAANTTETNTKESKVESNETNSSNTQQQTASANPTKSHTTNLSPEGKQTKPNHQSVKPIDIPDHVTTALPDVDESKVKNQTLSLNHPELDVRIAYLKKVSQMIPESSIPILEEALRNDNSRVRLLANQILRDVKSNQKRNELLTQQTNLSIDLSQSKKNIDSQNPSIRLKAIRQIAMQPKADMKASILKAAEDDDLNVKQLAWQALIKLQDSKGFDYVLESVQKGESSIHLYAILKHYNDQQIPLILGLFDSGRDEDAFAAIGVLREINSHASAKALKDILLNQANYSYRATLTLADMGELGENILIETLEENHKDETSRMALYGIKEIPFTERIKDKLNKRYDQLSDSIKLEVDQILIVRDPNYSNKDKISEKTAEAILAEYQTGQSEVHPEMLALMIGKFNRDIDQRALVLLGQQHRHALPVLRGILFGRYKERIKFQAMQAILKIKDENASKIFIDYLVKHKYRDQQDHVYDAILANVIAFGDMAVSKIDSSELSDAQKVELYAAINSLQAAENTHKITKDLSPSKFKTHFIDIVRTEPKPTQVILKLIASTEKRDSKKIMLDALGAYPSPDFVTPMLSLMKDPDKSIRESCLESIMKIKAGSEEISLLNIYQGLSYPEDKSQVIKGLKKDEVTLVPILEKALTDVESEVRIEAVEKAIEVNHPDIKNKIIQTYTLENNAKTREAMAKKMVGSRKIDIDYCLLIFEKPPSKSVGRKVTSYLGSLKTTSKELVQVGEALGKPFSTTTKEKIIDFLINQKSWPLTAKYIASAMPAENKELKNVFRKGILKIGRKSAAPELIHAANRFKRRRNTKGMAEVEELMKFMKIKYRFDQEKNTYVLE